MVIRIFYYSLILSFIPRLVLAASFEGSIQSLVQAVLTRILPVFAMFYVGHAAFLHIQDKPEAKDKAGKVAVGVVALLGINGVWAFLQSHVK